MSSLESGRFGNWHAPVTVDGEHNPKAGASVNRLAQPTPERRAA